MSVRERAIKGVFWSAVQNWGSNLAGTVVFLVLANLLEPADFGLVGFAAAILAILAIFQRQGFVQAIIQRPDLEDGHRNSAFWMGTAGGIVLAALTFATAELVAGITDKPLLGGVLRVLSLVLIIDALGSVPQALLRRDMAFRNLAMRSLAASSIGGLVGIAMALGGYGVWSLVGQRVTFSLSGTVTLWLATRWRPGLSLSARHFKDLFGFGAFMMGNEIVRALNRQSAPLLIGIILGDTALGFYRIAFQLLNTLTKLFNTTTQSVTLPTLSRIQHDHSQMRTALMTATRMTSLVALPAFLGASLLAPEILLGLCGENWAPSVPVMRFLTVYSVAQSITFILGPAVVACGRPTRAFTLSLVNGLTSVIVIACAMPWGIVAVAAAVAAQACAFAPLPLIVVRRLLGLELIAYLRQLTPPLLVSALMLAAVWAVRGSLSSVLTTRPLLAASVVVGVATYIILLRMLYPALVREATDFVRVALPRSPRKS